LSFFRFLFVLFRLGNSHFHLFRKRALATLARAQQQQLDFGVEFQRVLLQLLVDLLRARRVALCARLKQSCAHLLCSSSRLMTTLKSSLTSCLDDSSATVSLRNRLLLECDLLSADLLRWMDDNAIDDRTLPLLTDAHLLTVQPPLPLGARLRLLHAIQQATKTTTTTTTPTPTPTTRSRLSSVLAACVSLLCLPLRALSVLRPVARFLWRYAAFCVTLLFFSGLGVFGALALHKDLSAYAFQFRNVAVFGSWYVLLVLFVLISLGSLVWMHNIWLYFALEERSWLFGDPKAHRDEAQVKKPKAE
jgi:hypothetical protein